MLTILKQIFVWWNQQTLGTGIYTLFYGKFVGKDEFGNKYYERKKKNKRWVIYNGEIDASKISNEWYSWMHFTKNKIEINKIEIPILVGYNFLGPLSIFTGPIFQNIISIKSESLNFECYD